MKYKKKKIAWLLFYIGILFGHPEDQIVSVRTFWSVAT